jgi:lysozyme
MAVRRRRKRRGKKSTIPYLWIAVALLAVLGIVYFYSDISNLFKSENRKSKNFSTFKKDLPQYSVFGIDVSQYQADINWGKLTEEKLDFVIIRASAGKDKVDSKYIKNWNAAKDYKVIRGAYHYYRPDENSTDQAKFYIRNVKIEEGDLPPILDIEKYSRVQSLTSLKNGLLNWLKIVEEHYDVTPILYTYNNFYTTTLAKDSRFDKYPVWIAWYNIKGNPADLKKDWIFWQFTDKGRLKGIEGDVDVNVFNGKLKDLDGLRVKK